MIHVMIENQKPFRNLQITGHAGAGVKGTDIVCAGVSTLFCTLVERLEQLHARYSYVAESGLANVCLMGRRSKEENEAFDTIEAGLFLMAEKYPEYIKLL